MVQLRNPPPPDGLPLVASIKQGLACQREIAGIVTRPITGPGVSETPGGISILPPPPSRGGKLTAIELKTSLTPGGSATGVPVSWNSSTHTWTAPSSYTTNSKTVYDASGDFFGIGHDDAPSGVRGTIVWVDSRNIVVAGGMQSGIGKLDGSLSQGGTATVSVWMKGASTESDTGVNITVRDWLMKSGASAIASGKKIMWRLIAGTAYCSEAECP